MVINWDRILVDQLEFYWQAHLWPRLQGLTDEEYFWEPVEGCWSVRRGPDGSWRSDPVDSDGPLDKAGPVTTIAWRIVHIAGYGLGSRANAFFGPPVSDENVTMFDDRFLPRPLPGTAADALAYLQRAYDSWVEGVVGLGEQGLAEPLGPRGAMFAAEPMAGLVTHLSREFMHHGGEICLLRDLYQAGLSAR
jgi:hypothetical protein